MTDERQVGPDSSEQPPWHRWVPSGRAALVLVAAVFLLAAVVSGGLGVAPAKDEVHFWESASRFAGSFTFEDLRGYPEVVTPLALVAWGQIDHWTGGGIAAGRAFILAISLAFAVFLLGTGRGTAEGPRRAALATFAWLAFPYTLPLSVSLYTDVPAAVLGAVGAALHFRGRLGWAFLCFAAAIATRQYLVQIPAAVVAAEGIAVLAGQRERVVPALVAAAAAGTLLLWIAFFGGLAPAPGLEYWVPRYPAPMLEPTQFIWHYGFYALVGVGVWYVLPEIVLFGRHAALRSVSARRLAVTAALLALLFAVDPPLLTDAHPGGPFGRVLRWIFPTGIGDIPRALVFYGAALLAALRFGGRFDLAFWLVAATTVLQTKSQIPWEKYLLPTLATLWTLKAMEVGRELNRPNPAGTT